jgi:hypothetical protein
MKSGLKLYSPPSYKRLTPEARAEIINGCGAANARFDFIPDKIYGLDISEACNIHDYMYHIAEPTNEAKIEADRIFLNNLLRIIEFYTTSSMLKKLRRSRAKKYYKAVKAYGGPAFWDDKNDENDGSELK